MQLKSAWIGYNFPFDTVEAHPQIVKWRKNGLEKRVKMPEHHMTLGYFDSVDSNKLTDALKKLGIPLSQTSVVFDGFGVIDGYTYLTPNLTEENPSNAVRKTILDDQLLLPENDKDFHLSIGGADPFTSSKPKEADLVPTLTVNGRLVLVGKEGEKFVKLFWDDAKQTFIDPNAKQTHAPIPVEAVVIFPKIQADTCVALYILARFGKEAFPGIDVAPVLFWSSLPEGKNPDQLLAEGVLTIDLGGGLFDHHIANTESGKREDCASTLIAKYLGIDQNNALKKCLAWAKRDDLEGKGTISDDPLDRAFGLSGLMMNLNRALPDDPKRTLDYILPLIHFHVLEETKRSEELPLEWQILLDTGKANQFDLKQGNADLKCAYLETDNIALAGFLRAAKRMDLVVQRRASSGHTNIITRQLRSIDLRPVVEALRKEEAKRKDTGIKFDRVLFQSPGRIEGLDEWYYDDAANTIQNGGVNPGTTPATRMSGEEVLEIVKRMIPFGIIGALKRKKNIELGK
ncbi:hypothetical protein A3B20_00620 [Candidatus Uhrbacteria bacterium RIFCSPLOWO2_01_FULL_47_17]|nr:MAG: hypothetical protein A3B20_00620 [Candidatus Uhrbacteria bacterium RIFCSPLOWO2_01_FULL_47_17]